MQMVFFPPCKINLGLQVVGKRADGYHDLITCYYPVPWYDILEVITATEFSFTTSGISVPGASDENLCVKAYRLLQHDFGLPPIRLHLHKIIPLGAGLGGGSSDAAWTLRALNQKFNLNIDGEQLKKYAAQLGSDCAFFIQDKPQLGVGRGEILSDVAIDLRNKFMVVIKPDVHVSTAQAYAGVLPKKPSVDLKAVLENQPLQAWKELLRNDFEASIFNKYPVIADIKAALYKRGALYASMSGSGSAVFGFFSEAIDLKNEFGNHVYFSAALI